MPDAALAIIFLIVSGGVPPLFIYIIGKIAK
jgi:hypothetical protein